MRERVIYETPDGIPEAACIAGDRITLRPVTYADTADIIRWRNAPYVRDHFVFREPFTENMHETWLRERVAKGTVVQWIICEPAEGRSGTRPVGSAYLRDIDETKKTAEYGIFIGELSARGKGYAQEAAKLALRYAFESLHLSIVGLRVYKANGQARKGYLAAGFKDVKDMPAVESTDGKRADMVWMEARP